VCVAYVDDVVVQARRHDKVQQRVPLRRPCPFVEGVCCPTKAQPLYYIETIPSSPPPPGFECTICIDSDDDSDVEAAPCGHVFHRRCFRTWLRHRRVCPYCNVSVDSPVVVFEPTRDHCIPIEMPPQQEVLV
jgi:hypothetical protein